MNFCMVKFNFLKIYFLRRRLENVNQKIVIFLGKNLAYNMLHIDAYLRKAIASCTQSQYYVDLFKRQSSSIING